MKNNNINVTVNDLDVTVKGSIKIDITGIKISNGHNIISSTGAKHVVEHVTSADNVSIKLTGTEDLTGVISMAMNKLCGHKTNAEVNIGGRKPISAGERVDCSFEADNVKVSEVVKEYRNNRTSEQKIVHDSAEVEKLEVEGSLNAVGSALMKISSDVNRMINNRIDREIQNNSRQYEKESCRGEMAFRG